MKIELSVTERDLLKGILDSCRSKLRQAIAATKRDTSPLHGFKAGRSSPDQASAEEPQRALWLLNTSLVHRSAP